MPRPMWIVAQDAHAHLHRLVDEGLHRKAVVTGITQFWIVGSSFEFVPWTGLKRCGALFGDVAIVALIGCHRFMETLMLRDRRVTTRHGAARTLRDRTPAYRFLGSGGYDKLNRDKNADDQTYHTSHAQPAKLENPLFHPFRRRRLEFAHPHRLHGLQAPPDHLGQVAHEQIASLRVDLKEGM